MHTKPLINANVDLQQLGTLSKVMQRESVYKDANHHNSRCHTINLTKWMEKARKTHPSSGFKGKCILADSTKQHLANVILQVEMKPQRSSPSHYQITSFKNHDGSEALREQTILPTFPSRWHHLQARQRHISLWKMGLQVTSCIVVLADNRIVQKPLWSVFPHYPLALHRVPCVFGETMGVCVSTA